MCGRRFCEIHNTRKQAILYILGRWGEGLVCHEESLSWGFERGEIVPHKNSHIMFLCCGTCGRGHMIAGDCRRHLLTQHDEFRGAVMAIVEMIAEHPSACPSAVHCS